MFLTKTYWDDGELFIHSFALLLPLKIFNERHEHFVYAKLSNIKTLCICYKFIENKNERVDVIYGGSIMPHVKNSPPKIRLRATARARLAKCPNYKSVSKDEFGINETQGKAKLRRKFFQKWQRKYGLKGQRIPKKPCE